MNVPGHRPRYLLDTHVIVWALIKPKKLSAKTRRILADEDIYVSALTVWEIAQKAARGRQLLPGFSVIPAVRESGARWLALQPEHIEAGLALSSLHGDPFDRILVGTARIEGMVLLTRDTEILQGARPLLGPLLQEA